MRRLLSLVLGATLALAAFCATRSASAADTASPAAGQPATPVTLVGMTRAEVLALRGKPSGERQRGDTLVMIYPDGTRIELREGHVVAVSGAGSAEIIGADGTRHVIGADGTLEHPVRVIAAPAPPAEPASPESVSAAAPSSSTQLKAEKAPASVPASPVAADTRAAKPQVPQDDAADDLPEGATAPPSVEAAKRAALASVNPDLEETAQAAHGAPAPRPWVAAVSFIIAIVARFVFALLALRIAVHVIGVPFFWTDLAKVALLYLAVHEVIAGLAKFGGWWEFITIFRMDDLVSFVVLACALTWFKIAGSGLTALKIALAVKFAIVGLMMAVMLAVTFGLAGLAR